MFVLGGRDAEAGEAFVLAIRYSTAPAFWAAAGVRAGAAFTRAGQRKRAEEIVSWCVQAVPDCAELWLAMARLGTPDGWRQALLIAPELIVDLIAEPPSAVDDAAQEVLDAGCGGRCREAAERLRDLADYCDEKRITHEISVPTEPHGGAPERLAWCVVIDELSRRVLRSPPYRTDGAAGLVNVPPAPTGREPERPTVGSAVGRGCLGLIGAWLVVAIVTAPFAAGDTGAGAAIGVVLSIVFIIAIVSVTIGWHQARRTRHDSYQAARDAHARGVDRRGRQEDDLRTEIARLIEQIPQPETRQRVLPMLV